MRLDQALVERGFVTGRDRAKELIKGGKVLVDGIIVKKPSQIVALLQQIQVREDSRYVSRGGLKLEKALQFFLIDLAGQHCMDIGASTGGFTDCMLQHGAESVIAIDVGTDQLVEKLRKNPRVHNLEQTNIRDLQTLPNEVTFATIDVSFISLALVLPAVWRLLAPHGQLICLVKPQFEAGKGNVGKKGVVRDRQIHQKVLFEICNFSLKIGFTIMGINFSPITGPEGNREFLLWLGKSGLPIDYEQIIPQVVALAHEELGRER